MVGLVVGILTHWVILSSTDIERICTKPTEEDKYFFSLELIGQKSY